MIGKAWNALAFAAFLAAGSPPVAAQGTGSLTSKIKLENSTPSSDGQLPKNAYVTPDVVAPGDRLRVALTFTNDGTAPAAGGNAAATDALHVRWLWPDVIAPGKSRSVAFLGRVR